MKLILLALLLSGCSTTVTVLFDSCTQRGVIDGDHIADCKVAKKVK